MNGGRVLVAEDETVTRLDVRALLEGAGYVVCAEARDGLEAVDLARRFRPDLVVMDVRMPHLDGIAAARRIREERPVPIVMLTAHDQAELVAAAADAGVFGYLVKPFREEDLVPAVRAAQARHEELSALREQTDSLAETIAGRAAIDRAKRILMTKQGLTEDDAFRRLRRASQASRQPMRDIAEAVIRTLG
jgi:response regulator NasT